MSREAMHVHVVDQDDQTSVVQVRSPAETVELFVRTTGTLAPDLTMWVPLLLPVAMRHDLTLRVHGPVDEQAINGASRAQAVLAGWWPHLSVVPVEAEDIAVGDGQDEGVGLAFSAGVDAFHSLHRHLDEVTHLWFVHGFDVPLWRTDLRAAISDHLGHVADVTGKQLVQVTTNVKPWADRHVRWGEVYVGPATAGIAVGHAPLWGRSLIASSGVGEWEHKWATHPDLDPLWSSSRVEVVHDAAEQDRVEKVREIGTWGLAMDHLRVCWLNPEQEYNCGRCEKCSRTIVNLIAAGARGACATLPEEPHLPLSPLVGAEAVRHWTINVPGLESQGREDLVAQIEDAIRRGPAADRRRRVKGAVRRVVRQGRRR